MVARAYELTKSRAIRFDARNPGTDLHFLVVAAASRADIEEAIIATNAAPYYVDGFARLPWSADPQGGNVWEVQIPYGVPNPADPPALFVGETLPPEAIDVDPSLPDMTDPVGYDDPFGDYPLDELGNPAGTGGGGQQTDTQALGPEWSFDTTGGTRTVRQCLLDPKRGGMPSVYIGRTPENLEDEYGPTTDFGGAIGVKKAGDKKYDIEGKEVPDPKLEISTTRNVASISRRYIRLVAEMTASVNKTKFSGYEAGSLLFLGATGQYRPPTGQTAGGWAITYRFAHSPNLVASIEPPPGWDGEVDGLWKGIEIAPGFHIRPGTQKDGWDLLEPMFEEEATGGRLLPRVAQVAIHRVFNRTDFRKLGFKYLNA